MPPLLILAVLVFLINLYTLFLFFNGSMKMRNLADHGVGEPSAPPLVSIIVPACNEEKTLEPALRSLLALNYPNREIIVIDDRSSDGTFALLQKLSREFSEIRVEQVQVLPPGWLGKNHALSLGADRAQGEILLFTDADIVMEPSTLNRAVTCFVEEKLDHLALVFQNVARGGLLNAMIVDALGGLFLLLRPWAVRENGSKAFIGIGAFNMIAAEAYRKLGGHAAFKMHPIDDIMLGKKVKGQGMRQDCLLAMDFVKVRWYENIGGMIDGLMKNIFALYSYRLTHVAVAVCGIVALTIVPFWGMILLPGMSGYFFAAALFCRCAVFMANARRFRIPPALFLWSLVSPYLTVFIIVRAVWTTVQQQGIDWRGTHYPLEELKKEEPLLTFFLR